MSLIYLSLCSIIINERWGEVYWREGGGKGGQSGPRKFTGEVYWGSLPGNKAPVDFLQGLTGGGLGKEGEGGEGAIPATIFLQEVWWRMCAGRRPATIFPSKRRW